MAKKRPLLELVGGARNGDAAALAEILSRFRPLVRGCSRGLSQADREDLEQELSMLLIHLITRYDPYGESRGVSPEEALEEHGAGTESEREQQPRSHFG